MKRATASPPSAALRASGAAALSGRERVIAAYIRVSSASQDHAYQRRAIELAASARGEPVTRWYAETASGKSLERKELQKMRAALGNGELATVWVWRVDRLTRSGIADTLELVREIRESGAALRSVADGYAVDGGATGELLLAVMAWAAQLEREKIAENQTAARARMASQGRAWGRPALSETLANEACRMRSAGKYPREIAMALQISQTSVRRILALAGYPTRRGNSAAG